MRKCLCGCGQEVKKGRKYTQGHTHRYWDKKKIYPQKCKWCGHEWMSSKMYPKECVKCKHYIVVPERTIPYKNQGWNEVVKENEKLRADLFKTKETDSVLMVDLKVV